jgi:ribulose-5-phosphate 4-epimerase/fuculose-1-phosphate aldolase
MTDATEQRLRIDLAAAYRLAAHFGMDDLIYTHFSARLPDGSGDFLLNPYGLLFDEITASSLIRVTPEGEVVGRTEHDLNVFGYKIHEPFYRLRPAIGSVMHTHTPAGIAVSAMACGLLPLSQMAMHFYKSVGSHAYEGNAFTPDEQRRLIEAMGEHRAVFLQNHGLLAVGETVAEAFSRLYYLEQCCRIQVQAMAGGGRLIHVPEEVALAMNEQYVKKGLPFSRREWPALLRRLDRVSPGYKD